MIRHRGFTLMECTTAMVVLGAVLSGVAMAMMKLEVANIEFDARSVALEIAANVMERATALVSAGKSVEQLAKSGLPQSCERTLPEGKLKIHQLPSPSSGLTNLHVVVEWQGRHGTGGRSVRLVSFVRRPIGVTP